MDIGKRLSAAIKASGETQTSFAEKTGVSRSQICLYCSGRREPSTEVIGRLARELGVTTDFLLGLDEDACDERMAYIHTTYRTINEADKTLLADFARLLAKRNG